MKVRDKVSAVNRVNDPAEQGFVTPSFQPPFGVNFFPTPRKAAVQIRTGKGNQDPFCGY